MYNRQIFCKQAAFNIHNTLKWKGFLKISLSEKILINHSSLIIESLVVWLLLKTISETVNSLWATGSSF